jgi:hypothetical protein
MSKNSKSPSSHEPFIATHRGGCHCGAVRFEVALAPDFKGSRCNCSICTKTAVTGAIVKPEAFRLVEGEAERGSYRWGGNVSTRFFCKHCGIHCYGAGHLDAIGGDFVSVNLNCLDDFDPNELELVHWDGRHDNWMAGPSSTPWPLLASRPLKTAC